MARLKDKYEKEIVAALTERYGYKNPMQVPKITKIVINMGVNTSLDHDVFKSLLDDLAQITGQKPIVRRAKKSIANFVLREGMPIGAKVTLRGKRMYEFLDRLVNVALSRLRDFRGVSPKGFDGRGNYTLGLREQVIFTEIDPDKVKRIQGMDITINTTAKENSEAKELLKLFGMPFAGIN